MNTENDFTIKTPHFEGPIDLLLQLIEARSLSVSSISLSLVADSFLNLIKQQESINVDEVSSFVSIASTLIYLKSKELLPVELQESNEEEVDELIHRIEDYKTLRALTNTVTKLYGKTIFKKRIAKNTIVRGFLPDKRLSKSEFLHELFLDILEHLPEETSRKKVTIEKVVPIHVVIEYIYDSLRKFKKTNLRQLIAELNNSLGGESDYVNKKSIGVVFLGMLELSRNGTLNLIQSEPFGSIEISSSSTYDE